MSDTETINMIIGFCISADNNMTIVDRQNNILNLKKLAQNFTLTDYQIDIISQGIDLLEKEITEEVLIESKKGSKNFDSSTMSNVTYKRGDWA